MGAVVRLILPLQYYEKLTRMNIVRRFFEHDDQSILLNFLFNGAGPSAHVVVVVVKKSAFAVLV
jgi:hypothetical protein